MDASTSAPPPASAGGTPTPDRPLLDVEELRRALLVGGGLWTAVEVSSTTASTNADVVAAVAEGAPEGLVVTTEHQTAGRGRLDRRWEAPPRSGLVVSVLLRPDAVALPQWTWLPRLAGIAVDLTARDCGVASGLKWPNDVLVDGRKLCGILVERAEGPAGAAAVLGIGINLTLTREELPVPTGGGSPVPATRPCCALTTSSAASRSAPSSRWTCPTGPCCGDEPTTSTPWVVWWSPDVRSAPATSRTCGPRPERPETRPSGAVIPPGARARRGRIRAWRSPASS